MKDLDPLIEFYIGRAYLLVNTTFGKVPIAGFGQASTTIEPWTWNAPGVTIVVNSPQTFGVWLPDGRFVIQKNLDAPPVKGGYIGIIPLSSLGVLGSLCKFYGD